jgi:hypothetical protein
MPEHLHYEEDDLFNRETHHEKSDVPIKPLFWFIAIFVIFAFVTHIVLYAMYRKFVKFERDNRGPEITAMQRPADLNVPRNQPLLQPFPRSDQKVETPPFRATPVTDLNDMRRTEEQVLTTYGWVDRQQGVVRMPIDVAKELALQRLNAAPATTTATATTEATP